MLTKVLIAHESIDALKSSPLWAEITKLFLVGGALEVCEIGLVEDEIDADDGEFGIEI